MISCSKRTGEYTVKFLHDQVKLWLHRLVLRRGYSSKQEPQAYEGAFKQTKRPDNKLSVPAGNFVLDFRSVACNTPNTRKVLLATLGAHPQGRRRLATRSLEKERVAEDMNLRIFAATRSSET